MDEFHPFSTSALAAFRPNDPAPASLRLTVLHACLADALWGAPSINCTGVERAVLLAFARTLLSDGCKDAMRIAYDSRQEWMDSSVVPLCGGTYESALIRLQDRMSMSSAAGREEFGSLFVALSSVATTMIAYLPARSKMLAGLRVCRAANNSAAWHLALSTVEYVCLSGYLVSMLHATEKGDDLHTAVSSLGSLGYMVTKDRRNTFAREMQEDGNMSDTDHAVILDACDDLIIQLGSAYFSDLTASSADPRED